MPPLKSASLRKCPLKTTHENRDPLLLAWKTHSLEMLSPAVTSAFWPHAVRIRLLLEKPWFVRKTKDTKGYLVQWKEHGLWSHTEQDSKSLQTSLLPTQSRKNQMHPIGWALIRAKRMRRGTWGCTHTQHTRGLLDIKKRGSSRERKTTLMPGFGGFRRAGKIKNYFIKSLGLNVYAQQFARGLSTITLSLTTLPQLGE